MNYPAGIYYSEILSQTQALNELNETVEEKIKSINKLFDLLQGEIAKSEGIGDELRDLVIMRNKSFDEKIILTYQELFNRLQQHIGKPILFVISWQEECFKGGPSRSHSTSMLETLRNFYFSIIPDPPFEIIARKKELRIHTTVYTRCEHYSNISRIGGYITTAVGRFEPIIGSSGEVMHWLSFENPGRTVEILIGNEIDAYFDKLPAEQKLIVYDMANQLDCTIGANNDLLKIELDLRDKK